MTLMSFLCNNPDRLINALKSEGVDLDNYPLFVANTTDKPEMFKRDKMWWLFKEDSKPIGIVCLGENYKIPDSVHLHMIEIGKDCRGKGYGTQIIVDFIYEKLCKPENTAFTLTPIDIRDKERPLTDIYYPKLGFKYVDGDRPYMIKE